MPSVYSRRRVAFAVLLIGTLAGRPVLAQFAPLAPSEYALKAAFVYQFLSYVTWPEGKARAGGPLQIGVMGAPALANNLAMLARGQAPDARAIEVRSLRPEDDLRDLDVLFVDMQAYRDADDLLQTAVADGVLTITDRLPRPAHSIINFEIIDNKVRFDVALGLARDNGLDISARLLQVALRVIEP